MSGPLFGGGGFLAGLQANQDKNEAFFERERVRLEAELQQAHVLRLGALAQERASVALADALTQELADEASGSGSKRRLSDPANVRGRNQAYLDTAEGGLRRLSAAHHREQLGFVYPQNRVDRLADQVEPADLMRDPTAQPRIAPLKRK